MVKYFYHLTLIQYCQVSIIVITYLSQDQIIIEKLSNKMYEKDLQIIGFVKNHVKKLTEKV